MELDIGTLLKKLTDRNGSSEKHEHKAGIAVSFRDGEHKIAQYTREKEQVVLHDVKTVDDGELKALTRGAKPIAACFSARGIYADLGDFSCVSQEATMAHIRSTVDKTGLFNEPYTISFRKVYEIDKIRARFSYLAIPSSELGKVGLLDENEALLDTCCPIEASIAALVATQVPEMCVALFEDEDHVRIIGAKAGTIYHLIALQKSTSFDLLSETLAGLSEMISLMRNSYNESPKSVFVVGTGEISAADIQDAGIDAEAFAIEHLDERSLSCFELLGNAHCRGYDFTPQWFRDTRTFSQLASYSMGISLAMAFVAVVLFFLGYGNYSEAKDYDTRARTAQQQYVRDIGSLEGEYASVLKQLDLTRINELITLYHDFESEPKLYTILGDITRSVPADLSITKVAIARADMLPEGTGGTSSQEVQPPLPTNNPVFRITIEGKVAAQYPQSKILFSTFLSGVQAHYPVLDANFTQTGGQANYRIACEAKK
jgi:hypothetical protein